MTAAVIPWHDTVAALHATAAHAGTVSSLTAHAPTRGRQHGLVTMRAKTPGDLARIARALELGDVEHLPDTDKARRQFDGYTVTVRAFRRIEQAGADS